MALSGWGKVFFAAFLIVFISAITLNPHAARAQSSSTQHHKKKHRHAHVAYAHPQPASYIVDAQSGKVLLSENPDALRYPASLTKMMTLYLTFEALKKGTLKLDQTIPVSEHASEQPQTNIALKPGDRIAVKDAILSIVVRSANDSAVTLGEALGGSEPAFARMMTEKAHALGMKHTVFYNASGLPDPAQHTTARDMAILGLALNNNFPQYFPFFKTETFSFHGLTYIGHNHVMSRYQGVDGIKTGYIRASGFNLVTSVNRYNHHLIAVVMGGSTSRARDDKMIALLDQTFTQIASKEGIKSTMVASAQPANATNARGEEEETPEGEGDLSGDSISAASAAKKQAAEAASLWGIQVGAYARVSEATNAARRAIGQAPQELSSAAVSVSGANEPTGIHRAQLINLSQGQAQAACHKLGALHEPCFVYRVN